VACVALPPDELELARLADAGHCEASLASIGPGHSSFSTAEPNLAPGILSQQPQQL